MNEFGATIPITEAAREDAAAILALQRLAYRSEAELYDDFSIPPLLQTLEQLMQEFDDKLVLKAALTDQIVGSVRAWEKEGTCLIERLIVQPSLQGRGLGRSLMNEVELRFPDVRRFELFTGHRSERNLRFYQKLGYREFKRERVHDKLMFVFLEKGR